MNKPADAPYSQITVHEVECREGTPCNCSLKIERKHEIKYLGIIFNSHLKWQKQVEYISNKVRKLIYKFC